MDAIHNEMLQVGPELMAELLFYVWDLVGKTKRYPKSCKSGLRNPIRKKGDEVTLANYRPLCMLSHTRKIIEGVIGILLLRTTESYQDSSDSKRG